MNLLETVALATQSGWRDDTAHMPSRVTVQLTRLSGDRLLGVAAFANGRVTWNVQSLNRLFRPMRGTSVTLREAITQSGQAGTAVAATLF
ncbi:hypothetical protein [Tessaracoccus sp.]